MSDQDKSNVVSFHTGKELFDSQAAAKRLAQLDRFIAIGDIDGEIKIFCTDGYKNCEYLNTVEQLAWYTKLELFGLPYFGDESDE